MAQREALQGFSEVARLAMSRPWEKIPAPPTVWMKMPQPPTRPPPRPSSSKEHQARDAGRFGDSNPACWTVKQWKLHAKASYAYERGKMVAKIGVPKEERDGLLPEELHSVKYKREYRYPGQDLEPETQDWEDFQRGKITRDKWLHCRGRG